MSDPVPSKAERAAEDAKLHAYFQRVVSARAAITQHVADTGEYSGAITCPVCNGSLRFGVAKCNGHVRARCHTEGCVSWIE